MVSSKQKTGFALACSNLLDMVGIQHKYCPKTLTVHMLLPNQCIQSNIRAAENVELHLAEQTSYSNMAIEQARCSSTNHSAWNAYVSQQVSKRWPLEHPLQSQACTHAAMRCECCPCKQHSLHETKAQQGEANLMEVDVGLRFGQSWQIWRGQWR